MEGKELKEEILELWRGSDRLSRIRTRGQSMEPLLQDGDEIEIRHSLPKPRIGDLILFSNPDGLVAHRVIGRRLKDGKALVLEKGDKSSQASLIPTSVIQGKVIRIFKQEEIIHLESPFSRVMGRIMAVYSLLGYGLLDKTPFRRHPKIVSNLSTLTLKLFTALMVRGKSPK
jgi:hypothetical protein